MNLGQKAKVKIKSLTTAYSCVCKACGYCVASFETQFKWWAFWTCQSGAGSSPDPLSPGVRWREDVGSLPRCLEVPLSPSPAHLLCQGPDPAVGVGDWCGQLRAWAWKAAELTAVLTASGMPGRLITKGKGFGGCGSRRWPEKCQEGYFISLTNFADLSTFPLKNEGGLIFEVTLYWGQYGSSG